MRKKYAREVTEYMRTRASAALLKTILERRLPRLVRADREKLLDTLMTLATPPLSAKFINPKPVPAEEPVPPAAA